MNRSATVDIYCERTSALFWAEPVNAATNIAFTLAALWAARVARKNGERNPLVWVLIVRAAGIGVGSFLFHTFANRWSEMADTLPIWSFVALFIFVSIHRMGGVKPGKLAALALTVAAGIVVLFMASGEGGERASAVPPPPDLLNGSGQYAPALIALLVLTFLMFRRRHPQRGWIIGATLAFAVSLVFRTIDMRVCGAFPLGTHFAWHLLNAVLVALLLQMLLRARALSKPPVDRPPPRLYTEPSLGPDKRIFP